MVIVQHAKLYKDLSDLFPNEPKPMDTGRHYELTRLN